MSEDLLGAGETGGAVTPEGGAPVAPGPPAPAAPTAPVAPVAPATWYAGLPEDLRGEGTLTKYASQEEAHRAHVELRRVTGVPADQIIKIPTDDAGFSEVYRRLGRPETPDGYNLPTNVQGVEGFDAQYLTDFKAGAHQAGLSSRQMEVLFTAISRAEVSQATRLTEKDVAQQGDTERTLRTEWGADFDKKRDWAKSAASQNFSNELLTLMQDAGLSRDPEFLRFMAKVGEAISEDSALLGTGGPSSFITTDPKQAKEDYKAMMQDKEQADIMRNPKHPRHKEVHDKYKALVAAANPEV